MTHLRHITVLFCVLALGALQVEAVQASQPAANGEEGRAAPWGETVDGLACRLVISPHFVIGQMMPAVIEVKNTSDRKRYIVLRLDPQFREHLTVELTG